MNHHSTPEASLAKLAIFEQLIGLSIDLHNLNAGMQKRFDLSIVQWLMLKKIVDQPGLSAGTLAEISGVHPSTLTSTLGRLEAMGLIYIQDRPSDLRRKLVIASFKGLEWCRRTEIAFVAALGQLGNDPALGAEFAHIRELTKELLRQIHTVAIENQT